jgi:RNA polymerase sigma factor (sigma-70 family)
MSTDAELLRRYVTQKSESAFTELVQRHVALVYSTALRQLGGDAHLAQDVTQTVFTALARKAESLTGRSALAGWLYLGAHHAAAQAVRTDQRRRAREQEAHIMHELFSPEASALPTEWGRVRPVLDDALRELRDDDREAVLLRFFERRPFAEIGAALNMSEDAARMRTDRALDKLHALLARRGITSTGAALSVALSNQAMVATPAGLATMA